ncbi:MAG: DMT family transporter [Pseudomonadota bacterium]
MAADRPTLGVFLMLLFCIAIPISDAMAKVLSMRFPLAELIFFRFLAQTVLFVPPIFGLRLPLTQSRQIWMLIVVRTVLHIAGLGMMFAAFRVLPLADAIAIAFVMPFILLLFGKVFLNEAVGLRRILACVVGFAGTLLVIRPSFETAGLATLYPLGAAVAFAFYMLVTRRLATECNAFLIQGVSGGVAVAALGTAMLTAGATHPELAWVAPRADEIALLVLFGVMGAASHMLMTISLRYAPASTLAPIQYLEIPVATLVGWLAFNALPTGTAPLGIAITIAAGLYIIFREQRQAAAGSRAGV